MRVCRKIYVLVHTGRAQRRRLLWLMVTSFSRYKNEDWKAEASQKRYIIKAMKKKLQLSEKRVEVDRVG